MLRYVLELSHEFFKTSAHWTVAAMHRRHHYVLHYRPIVSAQVLLLTS